MAFVDPVQTSANLLAIHNMVFVVLVRIQRHHQQLQALLLQHALEFL
jgi:hypothetical protein